MDKIHVSFCILLLFSVPAAAQSFDQLRVDFQTPPLEARPKALWPWVNGNFSLPQITHELEEARAKGMGGFDIWDVGSMMNPGKIMPDGPPFLSDESLQAIAHTIREADRIGLEIGLITSSSWNAGGAWVKPEHGAMGLFRSDTIVKGPGQLALPLPFPNIPTRYDRERKTLLYKNPDTGLPVFYKEVALLAHPYSADSTIQTAKLLDLNRTLKGKVWQIPKGKWRVIRYVCAPTGQPLMVPSANSNGLMLDHFSAEAQEANMQYVIGRLKSALGDLRNRSLKYLYEDSYEVNSAVWTPALTEAFERQNSYSLQPWLPALDGFTVGSQEQTARFLFDFNKTLSNLIIENHYAKGTEIAAREGIGFHAEAGGPGKPIHNVPFEDLKALGALTVPRGEFWNLHPNWDKLQIVKGIASASHIYNQKYVEAEAFTSVWLWQEGPGALKPLADRAMCEGLNRFVYHTFPHTPPESGMPGWEYNFGTLVNTTNGWWPKSQAFHDYLARCSYLLQQGNFVGDVAYYYGDEAPNFVPLKHIDPSLGLGYDYDVVNTEAILGNMMVKNGKIMLPHGQSYEILVLPDSKAMNPKVLQKIRQMVSEGAVVVGPKPERAYSLSNAAATDQSVRQMADELWGNCDGVRVRERAYGKGKIVWGKTLRAVLTEKGVAPDFIFSNPADTLDFIHRSTETAEIYFVRNPHPRAVSGAAKFRAAGAAWYGDGESGNLRPVAATKGDESQTIIPLLLAAEQSCFIVFQKNAPVNVGAVAAGFKPVEPLVELRGPWERRFQHRPGTPVADTIAALTSLHLDKKEAVRHFSGAVAYKIAFEAPANIAPTLWLELGRVREIAEVYLNGERLGYHWHPSHRFDISGKLKPGKNYLVVEVVNSINNFLVGDGKKPEIYRQVRSNISKLPNAWMKPFAEAPLIEAGLLGPVRVVGKQQ